MPGISPRRASLSRRSFPSCAAICRLPSKDFRAPIERWHNRPIVPEKRRLLMHEDDAGFRALMDKVTRDRGFRCSSDKDKCLRRRFAVRMRAKGTASHSEYARMLDADPREYDRLVRS